MEEVRVIFPDGSIIDIPKKALQKAIDLGGKIYQGTSNLAKFDDGTMAEIPNDRRAFDLAIQSGGQIMPQKKNSGQLGSESGGGVVTLPYSNNDFAKPKGIPGTIEEYQASEIGRKNQIEARNQARVNDFANGIVKNRVAESAKAINKTRLQNGLPTLPESTLESAEMMGAALKEVEDHYDTKIKEIENNPSKAAYESGKYVGMQGNLAMAAAQKAKQLSLTDIAQIENLKREKAQAQEHITKLLRAKQGDGYDVDVVNPEGKYTKSKQAVSYDGQKIKEFEIDPTVYLNDMQKIGMSVWDKRRDMAPQAQKLRTQPDASKARTDATLEGLISRQYYLTDRLMEMAKTAGFQGQEKKKAIERILDGKEIAGDRALFNPKEMAVLDEIRFLPKAFDDLTYKTNYGREVRQGMLEQALIERLGRKIGIDNYSKDEAIAEFQEMKKSLTPRDAELLEKALQDADFGRFTPYDQSSTGAFLKEFTNHIAGQNSFLSRQFGYLLSAVNPNQTVSDFGTQKQKQNIKAGDQDIYKAGAHFQVASSQFGPEYVMDVDPKSQSFLDYVENTEGIGGYSGRNIWHNSSKFMGQLAAQMLEAAAVRGLGATSKSAQFMGGVALPMYAATYDGNLRQSYDVVGTETPWKNYLYAGALSGFEGLTEYIGSPLKQMDVIKGAFMNSLGKTVKGMTVEQLRNMGKATAQTFAKDVLKGLAGAGINAVQNMGEEAFEEALMEVFTNATNMISNPSWAEANDINLFTDVTKTFTETFASMAIMGGFSARAGYKQARPGRLSQDALALVGRTPETYRQQIQEALSAGELTQEQADEKLRLVNVAEKAKLTTDKIRREYQRQTGEDISKTGTWQDGADIFPATSAPNMVDKIFPTDLHRTDRFLNMATANIIDLENKIENTQDAELKKKYEAEKAGFEQMRSDALDGKISIDPATGFPYVNTAQAFNSFFSARTFTDDAGDERVALDFNNPDSPNQAPIFSIVPKPDGAGVNLYSPSQGIIKAPDGTNAEWQTAEQAKDFVSQVYQNTKGFKDNMADVATEMLKPVAPQAAPAQTTETPQETTETTQAGQQSGQETGQQTSEEVQALDKKISGKNMDVERFGKMIQEKEAENPNNPIIPILKTNLAKAQKDLAALETEKQKVLATEQQAAPQAAPVTPETAPTTDVEREPLQPAGAKIPTNALYDKLKLDSWLKGKNAELRQAFQDMDYGDYIKMYEQIQEEYAKRLDKIVADAKKKVEERQQQAEQQAAQTAAPQPPATETAAPQATGQAVQDGTTNASGGKTDTSEPATNAATQETKGGNLLSTVKKAVSGLSGLQSNMRTESSRKIINAYREIYGFPPFTGALDQLYSAAKEANDYFAGELMSKINDLSAASKYVIEKAEEMQKTIDKAAAPTTKAPAAPDAATQEADLAAKKADIERRRQEELDKINQRIEKLKQKEDRRVKTETYRTLDIDANPVEVEITTNADGSRVLRARKINEDGSIDPMAYATERINNKAQATLTNEKLIKEYIGNEGNTLKRINIDENPDQTYIDKINAKYDAELAALEAAAPDTKTEQAETVAQPVAQEPAKPTINPNLTLRAVASGQMNADEAAIALQDRGYMVSDEFYDKLRKAEADYIESQRGFQVDDRVLVKGQNGNPDFFANFRGESKGQYVVVQEGSGIQISVDKGLVSKPDANDEARAKGEPVIGDIYKYPNDDTQFELLKVDEFGFLFKNLKTGKQHIVLDSVFDDLVNLKTGKAKWQLNEGDEGPSTQFLPTNVFTYDKDGNIVDAIIINRGENTTSVLVGGKQTTRVNSEIFNTKEEAQQRIDNEVSETVQAETQTAQTEIDLLKKIRRLESEIGYKQRELKETTNRQIKAMLPDQIKRLQAELLVLQNQLNKIENEARNRTETTESIIQAIEAETEAVESAEDGARAAELIETIEAAEEAILTNKPVSQSFKEKHGISEVELATEYNSMDKKFSSIYRAYQNLTGKELREDSDEAREVLSEFLAGIGREGIKLKVPLGVGGLVVAIEPKKTKPITKQVSEVINANTADDAMRPAMEGVFFDNGKMVATDAHQLVVIQRTESEAEIIQRAKAALIKTLAKTMGQSGAKIRANEVYSAVENNGLDGNVINFKTGEIVDSRFPNYNFVIPEESSKVFDYDLQQLIDLVNGAKDTLKNGNKEIFGLIFDIGGEVVAVNPTIMFSILQTLQSSGVRKVKLGFNGPTKAVMMRADNGNLGLVMPLFVLVDETELEKRMPISVPIELGKKKSPLSVLTSGDRSAVIPDQPETEQTQTEVADTIKSHLPKGGELKTVTEIEVSADGQEVSYGTKTRKVNISVKGMSADEIQNEITFEKNILAKSKKDAENFNEDEVLNSTGLTQKEKQDAITMHKQSLLTNEQAEKIVIPFYEKHLELLGGPKQTAQEAAKPAPPQFKNLTAKIAGLQITLNTINPSLEIDDYLYAVDKTKTEDFVDELLAMDLAALTEAQVKEVAQKYLPGKPKEIIANAIKPPKTVPAEPTPEVQQEVDRIVAETERQNELKRREERDAADKKALLAAIEKFKKGGGNLTTGGINPDQIEAAVEIAGIVIKRGAIKFADFVKDMYSMAPEFVEQFYESIKSIYRTYRSLPDTEQSVREQMDSPKTITQVQLNQILNTETDENATGTGVAETSTEPRPDAATQQPVGGTSSGMATTGTQGVLPGTESGEQVGGIRGTQSGESNQPTGAESGQRTDIPGTVQPVRKFLVENGQVKEVEVVKEFPTRLTRVKIDGVETLRSSSQLYDTRELAETQLSGIITDPDNSSYGGQTEQEQQEEQQAQPPQEEQEEQPQNDEQVTPERHGRDFVIPRDMKYPSFKPAEKIRQNIQIVKTLKELKQSRKEPTIEQQKILFQFSGFGGLKEIHLTFDRWTDSNKNLKPLVKEFWDELSDYAGTEIDKYKASINGTITNAHYTEFGVIRGMYAVLQKMGFNGGNILDPSAGIGHFFGAMPISMMDNSQRVAVEKDIFTHDILKYLYPDSVTKNSPYEEVERTQADLIISNIPFGNIKVSDPAFAKHRKGAVKESLNYIHNYFFVRAIEDARPNGLIAFITSSGTFDSPGHQKIREYIAEKTEFLGAVRLPSSAFKKAANTEVTTDIVFLRKFGETDTEKKQKHPFKKSKPKQVTHKNDRDGTKKQLTVFYNEYFHDNPDMVLGEIAAGSMYGAPKENDIDRAMVLPNNIDLETAIAERAEKIAGEFRYESTTTSEYSRADQYIKGNIDFRAGNLVETGDGKYGIYSDELTKNFELDQRAIQVGVNPDKIRQEIEGETALYESDYAAMEKAGLKVEDFNIRKITPVAVAKANQKAVPDFVKLRNALNTVYASEFMDLDEQQIESARRKLNEAYNEFVRNNGNLNKVENKRFITLDQIDGFNVLAIEKVDSQNNVTGLADIMTKRVVMPYKRAESAADISEAIAINLSEDNEIDIERISELLSITPDEAIAQSQGILYKNPVTGRFETAEKYLSGGTRRKLKEAKLALEKNPEYQQNVTALEANQPKDLNASEIYAPASATWIPDTDRVDWVASVLEEDPSDVKVKQLSTGQIRIDGDGIKLNFKVNNQLAVIDATGRKALNGLDLLRAVMENKIPPPIYYKEGERSFLDKNATTRAATLYEELQKDFASWIWKDDSRRERLVNFYNENLNDNVPRKYDGAHLKFDGYSNVWNLRKHQKDAAWMVMQNMGGILDHEVGTGKTLTMAITANKMKKMGLIKKPVMIGLKANAMALAADYKKAFPLAKVLFPTNKDLQNRQAFFAKIANNDWDMIILTHDQFGMIPQNLEVQEQLINEQIDNLTADIVAMNAMKREGDEGGAMGKSQVSNMQKRIDNLRSKLAKLQQKAKDNKLKTFDDMKIDFLFVDESQQFKNLEYSTLQTRVAGLGDPEGSQKAFDLLAAVRTLQKHWGGDKGVVFSSGTPISNTIVEMYSLLRYLRPSKLKELNMETFDRWANSFAIISTKPELGVTNAVKNKTRMGDFGNAAEMASLYQEMADVRKADDMEDLKRPQFKKTYRVTTTRRIKLNQVVEIDGNSFEVIGNLKGANKNEFHISLRSLKADKKIPQSGVAKAQDGSIYDYSGLVQSDGLLVNIPISREQRVTGDMLREFAESKGRAWASELGVPAESEAYMLLATSIAAKMAIDMRLVKRSAIDTETGKLGTAADRIFRHYEESTPHKGIQVVFSDLGTPKSPNKIKNVYDHLQQFGVDGDPLTEDALERIFGEGIKNEPQTFPTATVIKKRMIQVLEWDENEAEQKYNELVEEANKDSFNVYAELKRKLMARGVPEHEIAFIHDYESDSKKDKLNKAAKSGEVRVVLGSTQKLGTGVNIQDRIVAMHHLDVPWRPADLEQRNGRGIRSGNYTAEQFYDNQLPVYYYAVENTLDAFKYQLLDLKSKMIQKSKVSDGSRRISEGEDEENYAVFVAMISGNPMILEQSNIRRELEALETEKRSIEENQYRARRALKSSEDDIGYYSRRAEQVAKDIELFDRNSKPATVKLGSASLYIDVNGQQVVDYEKFGDKADKIRAELKRLEAEKEEAKKKGEKWDGSYDFPQMDWVNKDGSRSEYLGGYLDVKDDESITQIAKFLTNKNRKNIVFKRTPEPDDIEFEMKIGDKVYGALEQYEAEEKVKDLVRGFIENHNKNKKPEQVKSEERHYLDESNVIGNVYGFDVVHRIYYTGEGEQKYETRLVFPNSKSYERWYPQANLLYYKNELAKMLRDSEQMVERNTKSAEQYREYIANMPQFEKEEKLQQVTQRAATIDEQLEEYNESLRKPELEDIVQNGSRISVRTFEEQYDNDDIGHHYYAVSTQFDPNVSPYFERIFTPDDYRSLSQEYPFTDIYEFNNDYSRFEILRRAKQYFQTEIKNEEDDDGESKVVINIARETDNGIEKLSFESYVKLKEYLDSYEQLETKTALQTARENLRKAVNNFFNMGVIYDPETQALKQIELYKALYQFAKEYLKDRTKRGVDFVEHATAELSRMLGLDPDRFVDDPSFKDAIFTALEDASIPEAMQRTYETVYATVMAKTDADNVLNQTVDTLSESIAVAQSKGQAEIGFEGQKMSVKDANGLLNFLQRRQNPFVTEQKIISGGLNEISEKEFEMFANERAMMMNATQRLPATAQDFVESLGQLMGRNLVGTKFQAIAEKAFQAELQAAQQMRDLGNSRGTARAPFNFAHTETYEAAGQAMPEYKEELEKLLDYDRMPMQEEVNNLYETLRGFINQYGLGEVLPAIEKRIAYALDIRNPNSVNTQKFAPYLFVYLEAKAYALTEAALAEADPVKRQQYIQQAGEAHADIKTYSQTFGRQLTALNFLYQQLGRLGAAGRQAYVKQLLKDVNAKNKIIVDQLKEEIKAMGMQNKKMKAELDKLEKEMTQTQFVNQQETKIGDRISNIIDKICKRFGF